MTPLRMRERRIIEVHEEPYMENVEVEVRYDSIYLTVHGPEGTSFLSLPLRVFDSIIKAYKELDKRK